MKLFNKAFSLLFFLLLTAIPASAQVEMADAMRSEGKIYVVVAIIVIVLAGLFMYLFLLDRKVTRLENILKEKRGQTK